MRVYSEKELVIFGGVFKLTAEGADFSKITSKQIADAAGIGKATIYDYFSSKEEIITHALIYTAEQQKEKTLAALAQFTTFKQQMYCLYNQIMDTVENSFSIFNIIVSMGGPERVQECFRKSDSTEMVREVVTGMSETFETVLKTGAETGEITATDTDYIKMVFTANIFSVGKFRLGKNMSRTQICDNAYTMLSKALN